MMSVFATCNTLRTHLTSEIKFHLILLLMLTLTMRSTSICGAAEYTVTYNSIQCRNTAESGFVYFTHIVNLFETQQESMLDS
jgi:hypothetical protein